MPDNLVGGPAPHSGEAERAVIGAMLIDERCVPNVLEALSPDDFYSKLNRDIFSTIVHMFNFGLPIDEVTLPAQMEEAGVANENAMQYLLEIVEITPSSANVMSYAQIVRDYALRRSIADAGVSIHEMAQSGEGGAETILDAAERRVYALRQGRNSEGLEPLSKIMQSLVQTISETSKSGGGLPGVKSGLSGLDEKIMGLNNSDVIIIASRPGMGKTSIALNIALNATKSNGKQAVIFSLEMSRDQLAMRLLSSAAQIDNKKLQTGRLSSQDWSKIIQSAAELSQASILINDNPMLSVADMNAQCRRVKNLGLVVIDYLQLMQSASGNSRGYGNENRVQVVSEISRMMKIMAKELNVPVVCCAQLSRNNESRTNKRPMLSDLRESGSIEQDADIVLGLYREDYYNQETEDMNVAECIILKNRRGELGTVKLRWTPEYTTYTSLETRHGDDEYE
ncbi:MAG: replicative DNA helicase [Oscillospiraceae bacterium]|jgi:replicative DNA helicase|nr:replicative DNA helicase [Oscillospiraceae bacterium]